jgi:hypothetical protein
LPQLGPPDSDALPLDEEAVMMDSIDSLTNEQIIGVDDKEKTHWNKIQILNHLIK